MRSTPRIKFGKSRPLGTLYYRPPSDVWGGSSEWWPWESGQEVRGHVGVPRGYQVRLWASQKGDNRWEGVPARLEGLRTLRAGDLDSLAVLRPAPGWADAISHLTGLSELIVAGWKTSADELPTCDSLRSLVGLDIGHNGLGPDELHRVLECHPRLRFLYAAGNQVGSAVEAIARLTGLRKLDLAASGLTDSGLTYLALEQLDYLSLSECDISDETAPLLGRLRDLEDLRLGKTGVGDETILGLSCPSLRTLVLSDTQVTGETVDPDLLRDLEGIYLLGSGVTDAGLRRISRLPSLRTLDLTDTQIGDAGLAALNGHPSLESIYLHFTPTTPRAIQELIESVPTLRRIWYGLEAFTTPQEIADFAARG